MVNNQNISVCCFVPKVGNLIHIEFLVFGQEEELSKTYVVLCKEGSQIESRFVVPWRLTWGNSYDQKVGIVRICIDSSNLNSELSVYSVIDTLEGAQKSRPFRFRV